MSQTSANKPTAKKSARKKGKKKHTFLKIAALLLVIWWFNNFTMKTEYCRLTSPKLTSELRLAVIADLHSEGGGISNDSIVEAVECEKPDAVFFLGDMFSYDSSEEARNVPVELAVMLIAKGFPVYFVTGEHDCYDDSYITRMTAAGAVYVSYTDEYLTVKENKLHIMGINNVYYGSEFSLANEFANEADCFNIMLAHIPNYDCFAEFGADLTICADTHGGMAQIPLGGGPVYDTETGAWFPEFRYPDQKVYDKGFFKYDGGGMFISAGLGTSPAPVRFNNRPEVDIIEIKPSQE